MLLSDSYFLLHVFKLDVSSTEKKETQNKKITKERNFSSSLERTADKQHVTLSRLAVYIENKYLYT